MTPNNEFEKWADGVFQPFERTQKSDARLGWHARDAKVLHILQQLTARDAEVAKLKAELAAAHRVPAVQEAVYRELGTYEKLQEMHGTIEMLSFKMANLQPLAEKIMLVTGAKTPFLAMQTLLRAYEARSAMMGEGNQ